LLFCDVDEPVSAAVTKRKKKARREN